MARQLLFSLFSSFFFFFFSPVLGGLRNDCVEKALLLSVLLCVIGKSLSLFLHCILDASLFFLFPFFFVHTGVFL